MKAVAFGERPSLIQLTELLHSGPDALTVGRGRVQVDVPRSVRDVLTRIAEVLVSGRGVAIVPVDHELTTTEAAGLLGVSRPTLIKLLEAGEIGYCRPNSSRRIPLDQVLAYRDRRGQTRRAILDANVLIPNALCDFLLRLAENDLYQPRWSPIILDSPRSLGARAAHAPSSTRRPGR